MQPRKKRTGKGINMKRTDITAQFPDATDEQISAIMNINGNDINAAKRNFDELQGQLTAANTELESLRASVTDLQTVTDRANALQAELDTMKAAENIRTLRERVANETGVPASMLTFDTEEECQAQANSIKEYAKRSSYPAVKDGGEPHHIEPQKSNKEKFAEWVQQAWT